MRRSVGNCSPDVNENGMDGLFAIHPKIEGEMYMDKIIDTVCVLCREHELSGFEEGVKVGIRLKQELV